MIYTELSEDSHLLSVNQERTAAWREQCRYLYLDLDGNLRNVLGRMDEKPMTKMNVSEITSVKSTYLKMSEGQRSKHATLVKNIATFVTAETIEEGLSETHSRADLALECHLGGQAVLKSKAYPSARSTVAANREFWQRAPSTSRHSPICCLSKSK